MAPGVGILAARTTLPNGLVVGVETPLVLIAFPVAVIFLWLLVYRRASGTAGTRSRRWFSVSRLGVITLLVVAAAGPFTVATMETPGEPQVTVLVDRSDSMAVSPAVGDTLAADIEAAGVPATVATIGQGTNSRIGEGLAANLQENGSVVLVSDGRVTGGRSLPAAAEFARTLNATISTVTPAPDRSERYVTLAGPAKTSAGVESQFLAQVGGVDATGSVTLTVAVDGETVASESIQGTNGSVQVTHTFEATGSHRVTAAIDGDDTFAVNDVARKTVRVVEPPRVLYVAQGTYPLRDYLGELYEVDTADAIPADLDPYYAVVVQDLAADDLGRVDELQRFVIDGNGLVLAGGRNSFENGGYAESPIASMLPVTLGESTQGTARIILLVDVSGSAGEGMQIQKAVALDALSQLGNENIVGLVGFNYDAYAVAQPEELAANRAELQDRISRLQAGGATDIATGLRGAEEMLAGQRGTVILISDGHDPLSPSRVVADSLGRQGVRVIAIGAGRNVNERVLRDVAQASNGQYVRATETERLRLLFGGGSRQFEGEGLTVVDPSHFVTAGVTFESNPGQVNDVSIRPGADFLVAAEDGTPAFASWRYGLGRAVTITTYGVDGSLDGLLDQPDSLAVTKSVNYAIGDPERKATDIVEVGDTRVGEATPVTYRGSNPPSAPNLTFRAVDDGVFRAEVSPDSTGFETVAGATYAANYHAEYLGFGPAPAVAEAARTTGGQQFDQDDAAAIASFARQQSTRVRDVRQQWDWALLVVALGVFLAEVVVRRLQVYRGHTRSESGLP